MFFILLLGQWVSSSVLSRHSENLKQQTSVTAQLQLSFIWQAKENTSFFSFVRVGQPNRDKEKRGLGSALAPLFSPPPSLPYISWARWGGLFVSPEVLTRLDLPLFCFHGLFPFFVF